MKNRIILAVLIAMLTGTSCSHQQNRYQFADQKESASLLTQKDKFIEAWSDFDIFARSGGASSDKEKLVIEIGSQALDWSTGEKDTIQKILDSITNSINHLQLNIPFPKTIKLVKTTGEEEWGAMAYTRQNYIVLNENFLSLPEEQCYHILTHELFHIASRNSKEFRDRMYSIIGFENAGNLQVSDSLKASFITNPDTPENYSYTNVSVEGKSHRIAMILYSTRPYTEGDLMEYLNLGFIEVDDSENPSPILKEGKPVIFSYQQLEGFFDQVGQNTGYILHPEEILAENFAFAVHGTEGLPSPQIIETMIIEMQK